MASVLKVCSLSVPFLMVFYLCFFWLPLEDTAWLLCVVQ